MSDEKKIRKRFWEHDNVGLMDACGNVIVSPDLGYLSIFRVTENTFIVKKETKWALIDLDGNLLCDFIYDSLDYFCETRILAGIKIKVDYYHTSKVYSLLDEKGTVIVSPHSGYSEIIAGTEKAAIVHKGDKWALIDLDGNLLCPFYDSIAYFAENCFKAGNKVKPKQTIDSDEWIFDYVDTSTIFFVIDENGNEVFGNDKGFNFISDVYDGEATAAINGRCGIIDLKGNIIIPLEHKYVQPLGEGHYLLSYDNPNDNFWSTVINRNGEIMIPANMKYRSIGHFKEGVARAYQNGNWGLIDGCGNHICDFEYSAIDDCGKGYYRVVKGAKKNVMRQNGTLVLNEWFNDVYNVEKEFFIFGNTIKKSKDNPKTRYIRGVAHTNGDIVFPMIFESVQWLESQDGIYAQIGSKPYILTLGGGIFDPEGGHIPSKIGIDETSYFEKLTNWLLPGLQFFYRDTDANFNVDECYHIGDTIRAGFFIDATTKLQKPLHKTRFLIASAHAAFLYENDYFVRQNPNAMDWKLVTFHFNSFFKVMDVYKTPKCTQILLLHIPLSAASFLLDSQTGLNIIDKALGAETSLVQIARESLDQKLAMDYHPRSFDDNLCNRMEQPVGYDNEMSLYDLTPAPEPKDGSVAVYGDLVHKLSHDSDVELKIEEKDNFNWKGVEGTICSGCIYAAGIGRKGDGCSKLSQKSFRENVIKGECEHYKTKAAELSYFEKEEKRKKEEAKATEERQTDVFAIKLLQEFIDEKLNGNIDNLCEFDLSTLSNERKYGNSDISRADIVKAIMALVFADAWPDLNVDNINHYVYRCSPMNHFQKLLGSNIGNQYFMLLNSYNPSVELNQRAMNTARTIYTIGNIWVLPNKAIFENHKDSSKYHGYMDGFLKGMYQVFAQQKNRDKELEYIFNKNRKYMTGYQGEEGFRLFVHNMMLDDYMDANGMPADIFANVWGTMKNLDRETYFNAVDRFCSFCETAIPKRGKLIVDKLKEILK